MDPAESVEVRTRARVGNDVQDFATPLSGDRQLILPGRSTLGLTVVLSLSPHLPMLFTPVDGHCC